MRLIDGDLLMKTVFNDVVLVDGEVKGVGLILAETVDNAPTIDAVPVIRCRECKYSHEDEIFGNRWCDSHLGCRKVKDDGYCYLGERKEGAD